MSLTSDATSTESARDGRWLILGVIGLAQLMVILDLTVMNIALPSAQRALHFTTVDRQWVVTAYTLAFGSLLLLGGQLADLLGRKVTFLAGLAGFAGVSAIGGASVNFAMLITARACQGAFAALLVPSALSLLTTTFTAPKDRAKAFGIYGAIAGAGGAVGLLLGGTLTEYLSWRWTLYVNLIFAGVVLDRNRGGAYLSMFIAAAGLFGIFLFLTYYLQQTLGYSPLVTGFAVLPLSVGLIVMANLSAPTLSAAARQEPERAVQFYATDDPGAGDLVADLIRTGGYEPVRVGGLDQSIRIEMFGDLHEYGALGRTVTESEALAAV